MHFSTARSQTISPHPFAPPCWRCLKGSTTKLWHCSLPGPHPFPLLILAGSDQRRKVRSLGRCLLLPNPNATTGVWWGRWIGIGDESYMRPYLGSETMSISSGDYPFPDAPNTSRVQFEQGLNSLWCKHDELWGRGLIIPTTKILGHKMYFFGGTAPVVMTQQQEVWHWVR
jgi:hypothetical protein